MSAQESEKKISGNPHEPKNRPARIPMGERGRLYYDPALLESLKKQGLVPRLFNDTPGRIDAALAAGYRFVQADGQIGEDRAAAVSKMGGNMSAHVGGGMKGYLMVLPEEWHQEDQKAKQKKVDASEEAMRGSKEGTKLAPDADGKAYGAGLTND
jgi:hypothetical protein